MLKAIITLQGPSLCPVVWSVCDGITMKGYVSDKVCEYVSEK